jgi:hypothetical protein
MTAVPLEQPITSGGIRTVNFFNGRLLTGEDLSREQEANVLARLRLGRVLGSGVAHGLEVSQALVGSTNERPVLTVEAGIAVAPSGRVLELTEATDVALTRDPPQGGSPSLVFHDCAPTLPGTYTAGAGVYLLTLAPASAGVGRASTSGLGSEQAACATAAYLEGVRFRLLRLVLPAKVTTNQSLLRNRLAHLLLGTQRLASLTLDPLNAPVRGWGFLEELREGCLTDGEVPLAVLYWRSAGGLRFVDTWAVRRRLTRPPAAAAWPAFAGERLLAEGEARFLQFQDQLDGLRRSAASPLTVKARTHFERLPPLGIVPVGSTASARGFHHVDFFDGMKARKPIFVEGSILNALVRTSFAFPAFSAATSELVWLYLVRENAQAAGSAQQYVVFANPHMPFAGDPRFDTAYWDFANYSLLSV